jgi:oxygen-independent coproporphyrinogen-3 oxidase
MSLGIYVSVPFCRTKCSFCNFASDVFSKSAYENYVGRVLEDIRSSHRLAAELGCALDENVDSIYLGGGTPSILEGTQLRRIFAALRDQFAITSDAEITVECAPGTLTSALIETLLQCGVNRVSLGVQSFVDHESQSVGRLHSRSIVIEEICRLREAGLDNISIDLIAGLPHQTAESWAYSLSEMIATSVPHASVYMLEVDDDSRLGRELIAGGARYHAHFVPDDDATADFYQQACEMFDATGIAQYEISNFARAAAPSQSSELCSNESRHNLKYWTRQPYLGFGVDAHSMLSLPVWGRAFSPVQAERSSAAADPQHAIRFATPDSLDAYMNRTPHTVTRVSVQAAIEENFFLGLRLNRGIDLNRLGSESRLWEGHNFSRATNAIEETALAAAATDYQFAIQQCVEDRLLEQQGSILRLTARGRLLSNEVFARFLTEEKKEKEETKVGTGNVNPR